MLRRAMNALAGATDRLYHRPLSEQLLPARQPPGFGELRAAALPVPTRAAFVPQPPAPQPAYRTLPSLQGHIALYGGSFNPPHVGHAWVCEHLLTARKADAVWMIPVYKHPEGKVLADFSHRMAMCESLGARYGKKLRVMPTEKTLGGVEETSEVLAFLQQQHPRAKFVLVLGADLIGGAPGWAGWPQIVRQVPIEVVRRSGFGGCTESSVNATISSSAIRQRLLSGDPVVGAMPSEVEQYVVAHGLYR